MLHKNKVSTGGPGLVWSGPARSGQPGPVLSGLAQSGPVRLSSSNLCCHFKKTSSAPLRTASLPEASGRINYCLCSCCPGTKKKLGSAPEQVPGSLGSWEPGSGVRTGRVSAAALLLCLDASNSPPRWDILKRRGGGLPPAWGAGTSMSSRDGIRNQHESGSDARTPAAYSPTVVDGHQVGHQDERISQHAGEELEERGGSEPVCRGPDGLCTLTPVTAWEQFLISPV